jgi:hypothetical protein
MNKNLFKDMKMPALPEGLEKLMLESCAATYQLMDSPLWQPFTVVQRLMLAAGVNGYLNATR